MEDDRKMSQVRAFRPVSVLLLLVPLAASCAVQYSREMEPVRSAMTWGGDPLAEFGDAFPSDSTGRDRLLFLMEKGNLLRLAGRYEEARRLLLEADRLSDMQRGTDLGEQAASMLTSDLVTDFRGADYEQVFINYCLAMCYALDGELDEALVECRRVGEKLEAFNARYEHDNRYRDDAFARYLMGILFEASGDLDNALVAYRNSLGVYEEDYAALYGTGLPASLEEDLLRLTDRPGFETLHDEFLTRWPDAEWRGTGPGPGRGEAVLVFEEGLIPLRHEETVEAWSEDRVWRLAVPAIRLTRHPPSSVSICADGASSRAFLVQDLGAIAERNLEDHAARDLARTIARAVIKSGAADLTEQAVEELTGEENSIWSEGAGMLVSILGAATEHADLRAWLTLPRRIYLARLPLEPGFHRLDVRRNGRTIDSRDIYIEEYGTTLVFLNRASWR